MFVGPATSCEFVLNVAEDRMGALDDVTWSRPLAKELERALRVYRQRHPWVDLRDLSPESVVREMHERAMTFGEGDAWHVAQILDDPEGDRDWRIAADLDLPATDEAGELVFVVSGLGPA